MKLWHEQIFDTGEPYFKTVWTHAARAAKYLRSATWVQLKVRQFQNEFIKSLFLPKYEQKIVKMSMVSGQMIKIFHCDNQD